MAKRRTNRRNRKTNRRNRRRTMRGGMCPLAVQAMGGGLGAATQQALAQGGQFAANTRSYHGGFRTGGAAYGVNQPLMGGRRRKMRGGMAPLSIFGQEGVDVQRASAHLAGQDAALKTAADFSRTLAGTDNPGASTAPMVGGGSRKMSKARFLAKRRGSRKMRKSRRRGQRGGAILNGDGAPAGASYMLLGGDAALQRAAAQVENPAWADVAKGQFA